jgi:hypothetical protein
MPVPSLYTFLNRHLLFTVIGALATLTATAQKLPNKQTTGLHAPSNIKIDGKDAEWHNQFQAYNNATEVYYTMANDNDNLYFTVQATDPTIINRIMSGGISLTLQKTAKKDDKSAISITYPVIETSLYFSLRRKKNAVEDTTAKTADSVMKRNNALIAKNCKWIRVTGLPGVDTLTSIYNLNGIKAAGLFNDKKIYTCEFAIKIGLIKTAMEGGQKINYHVRLNGSKAPVSFSIVSSTPGNEAVAQQMVDRMNALGAQQAAPTDFWGEYTLVK